MKNLLRIALPALADLTASLPLAYARFDRSGRCVQRGSLPAAALANAFPRLPIQAVLHAHDAIVAAVQVPAVPKSRFPDAVRSALEALVLGELDSLAVGHGLRSRDGEVTVAWADKEALRRAWLLLSQAGLEIRALIPVQALGGGQAPDAPLLEPTDPRWLADTPSWSLALPQLAPRQVSHWRPVWRWAVAAAVLWVAGLNLYAMQLRGEATRLRDTMVTQVRDAFPGIPVVLDPVRQAQQGYDALATGSSSGTPGDFIALARAGAQALPFAADQVDKLVYRDQALDLQLADQGGSDHLGDMPAIMQKASASGIRVEHGDNSATWRIVPVQP
ncbi:MAG TPA: type II secretion system protein GspL [Bordetella sp.]